MAPEVRQTVSERLRGAGKQQKRGAGDPKKGGAHLEGQKNRRSSYQDAFDAELIGAFLG